MNKNLMKKLAAAALTMALAISLTACGSEDPAENESGKAATTESNLQAPEDILASMNESYGESGMGSWTYDSDTNTFTLIDGSGGIDGILEYYAIYGNIDALQDSWSDLKTTHAGLAKTISDATGINCTVAIANTKNTDNVLFAANKYGEFYDAFE